MALVAVVAVAWWIGSRVGDDDSAPTVSARPTSPVTARVTPARVPRPASAFAMKVTYVYDGDTIQAAVVAPNQVVTTDRPIRIRLIGIDAPEAKPPAECWGAEATAWLRAHMPAGTTIWAAPDRDSWDDYGRRLFDIWTADGFVNLRLAREGQARSLRVWPNVAYAEPIAAAERQAATQRRGLWRSCASGAR